MPLRCSSTLSTAARGSPATMAAGRQGRGCAVPLWCRPSPYFVRDHATAPSRAGARATGAQLYRSWLRSSSVGGCRWFRICCRSRPQARQSDSCGIVDKLGLARRPATSPEGGPTGSVAGEMDSQRSCACSGRRARISWLGCQPLAQPAELRASARPGHQE
jgi:hypothetical protein